MVELSAIVLGDAAVLSPWALVMALAKARQWNIRADAAARKCRAQQGGLTLPCCPLFSTYRHAQYISIKAINYFQASFFFRTSTGHSTLERWILEAVGKEFLIGFWQPLLVYCIKLPQPPLIALKMLCKISAFVTLYVDFWFFFYLCLHTSLLPQGAFIIEQIATHLCLNKMLMNWL